MKDIEALFTRLAQNGKYDVTLRRVKLQRPLSSGEDGYEWRASSLYDTCYAFGPTVHEALESLVKQVEGKP